MPKVCVLSPAAAGRSSFALFEEPRWLGSSRHKPTDFWKLGPLRGDAGRARPPHGTQFHLNTEDIGLQLPALIGEGL